MIIPYKSDVEIPRPAFLSMGLVIVNVALLVYTTGQTSPLFYFDWGFVPVDHSPVNWVSHMFLHGGFGHLLGNMWFLWICGPAVEWSLGSFFYLPAYLLFGLAATAINTSLTPDSLKDIPCIGASGAISGVMGAYLVLYPKSQIKHIFVAFLRPIFFSLPAWAFLGFWFLEQGVMSFYVSDFVTVAVGAHLGGFLTGAGVASIFKWAGSPSGSAPPAPGRVDTPTARNITAGDVQAEYADLKFRVDRRPDDLALRHALAMAAARAGDLKEAVSEAGFVMHRYPEHDLKHRFKLKLLLNSLTDKVPTPEDVLMMADGFDLIKKYPEHTAALYRQFLKNWPNHPRRPGALLKISNLLVDHFKQPKEAVGFLEEAARGDPRSGLVLEAKSMLEKISLSEMD